MNLAKPYKIESIESCRAPLGIAEGRWCRYVVANNKSRIEGRYRGSKSQARRNAESLVEGLNRRIRKGASPWAPKGRKSATTKSKTATNNG